MQQRLLRYAPVVIPVADAALVALGQLLLDQRSHLAAERGLLGVI